MPGTQIRILDKTTFDFGSVAVGATAGDVFFASNVDVSGYQFGTLLIRVHTRTVPTNGKVTFSAFTSAPTSEDPASIFRGPALAIGTIEITPSTPAAAPGLIIAQLPTGFGGTIDFSLKPTYVAGGGAFSINISVDLVLKS